MDRADLYTIIDYNLKINELRKRNGAEVADELISYLGEFGARIAPMQETNPRAHAYITSGAKISLMSTVFALGTSNFSMTASDQIRVLEAGFTGNGPFAGVAFPNFKPVREDSKFLAACYQFVMNHPGNTNEAANHYLLAVSITGFLGGQPYNELINHIKEAEQTNGQSRIDAVDYLVREFPLNSTFNNDTAVILHDNGGLIRCLELKIDLKELLHRLIDNLSVSSSTVADLAKIHSFCNQINGQLYSSLKISRATYQLNAKELLTLALDLNKGSGRLLDASSSIQNINLSANQVIKIASFSSKQDHVMRSWINNGRFDGGDIKKAVQRLDASVQYQVIDRLELKSLYSPRELNLITGRRLEREMGL